MLEVVRSRECSMHFRVSLAQLSEAIRRRDFSSEIDFNDRRALDSRSRTKRRRLLFLLPRTKTRAEEEEDEGPESYGHRD